MPTPNWTERFQADTLRENDHRSPYQRDRARVLHSEAFRCLQAKTQIHAIGEDDFYRTRLTHSLEVAQIGSSLRAKLGEDKAGLQAVEKGQCFAAFLADPFQLLPSRSLIETLCYAHDIGHPPFGHSGETALNYKMRDNGGFEGNAQSFRIVTQLEPYTKNAGMNLTRRALLGIIKYPALLNETAPRKRSEIADSRFFNVDEFKTSKGLYADDAHFLNWVLQPLSEPDKRLFRSVVESPNPLEPNTTRFKSLDCSIMELADDIAYGVHDLEDAIAGGMITPQMWEKAENALENCTSDWIRQMLPKMRKGLFSPYRYERKDVIGALVNYFITHVKWHVNPEFDEPLLRFNAVLPQEVKCALDILKRFLFQYVIFNTKTQLARYKGQRILMELFDIFSTSADHLLPENYRETWQNVAPEIRPRVIADYLASQSDRQAFKLYSAL